MARLGNGVFFQHECFTSMPRTAYCATFGSKPEQKHTGFLLQNPNFDQMVTAYGPRFVFGMTAAVGSDTFLFAKLFYFIFLKIWKFYQMKQEKQSAATKGHCVLRELYS